MSLTEGILEYVRGDDTRGFRHAISSFATGVTVATTNSPTGPVGLTANSFTSVSLEPALVLICLAKSLGCLEVFSSQPGFCINVLQSSQRALSRTFATKGIDRFQGLDWESGRYGAPIIKGALANVECVKQAELDYGDHVIFVGGVERARFDRSLEPLLYYAGEYRELIQS